MGHFQALHSLTKSCLATGTSLKLYQATNPLCVNGIWWAHSGAIFLKEKEKNQCSVPLSVNWLGFFPLESRNQMKKIHWSWTRFTFGLFQNIDRCLLFSPIWKTVPLCERSQPHLYMTCWVHKHQKYSLENEKCMFYLQTKKRESGFTGNFLSGELCVGKFGNPGCY